MGRRRRWRRRRLRVLAGVVLLVVVASVAYRVAYGTWWGEPERIPYCGRTYLSGTPGLSFAEVRRRTAESGQPDREPNPLLEVGKAPPIVGARLVAAVTPADRRAMPDSPCAMAVYLQTGADSYRAYGLSGGP